MAVPFALPEDDDNNAVIERLLLQLESLLRLLQLQMQLRQTRTEVVGASSRVRLTSSIRRNSEDQEQHQQTVTTTVMDTNHLPELITLPSLLTNLSIGEADAVPRQFSVTRRRRRRRTNSESSCCEDGKPIVLNSSVDVGVTMHWMQEEEQAQDPTKESRFNSDSLLSKLVPSSSIRSSIWTAVICVVGWHLLKSR